MGEFVYASVARLFWPKRLSRLNLARLHLPFVHSRSQAHSTALVVRSAAPAVDRASSGLDQWMK